MASAAFVEGTFLSGSVDDRRVSVLRLLLSLTALLITFIDPSEPEQLVPETYLVLVLYCAYSLVLYLLSIYSPQSALFEGAHWIDVAWFTTLVALSSGTGSIFFFFYLFAVLVASFRWGFFSGIRVAIVSAVLFVATAALTIQQTTFELNRLLLRPAYLLLFGYLIAFWGGRELLHRRRLSLLAEVSKQTGSRSGPASMVESLLKALSRFYGSDHCLLLFADGAVQGADWFEIKTEGEVEIFSSESTEARLPLLKVPGDLVVLQRNGRLLNKGPLRTVTTGNGDPDPAEAMRVCDTICDLLSAQAFLTVPLIANGENIGRIYVTGSESGFEDTDPEFLCHLAAQVVTLIEHDRLMESLASGAVHEQRRKISYDIHDGTIQPYIGLKLGLEAVEMKAEPGSGVARDLRRLIDMAEATISDLRNFVRDLKDSSERRLGEVLGSALERLARQFRDNHGIDVVCSIDESVSIGDRLAAELFQMTAEGLSNIRRHTGSKCAEIRVLAGNASVLLEIENVVDSRAREFVPATITARAEALGGNVTVTAGEASTLVKVEVPAD
ncbi:MAG TPA: histidine kinase [Aridibacter sp.]|nr:histidine kinase [Aridibacter sp.]